MTDKHITCSYKPIVDVAKSMRAGGYCLETYYIFGRFGIDRRIRHCIAVFPNGILGAAIKRYYPNRHD